MSAKKELATLKHIEPKNYPRDTGLALGAWLLLLFWRVLGEKKLKRAFKTRRENVSHTAYPDVHCVRLKASRGGHVHPSASWSSEILPRVPSVCFRLK